MTDFSKHRPQQAVFFPKSFAEVEEVSNLGKVKLPEQKVWRVIYVDPSETEIRENLSLIALSAQRLRRSLSRHANRPVEYFERVTTIPPKHKSAVEEGIGLAERLNQGRLGGQGKILGIHKSVEGEDYVIWMEVPLEIYKDLDLTTEIGVEVLKLSDHLGVPFFLYFVPPGYSHYFG